MANDTSNINAVDEEHPSAWLSDSDGWIVDVYEGGPVIVSDEIVRRLKV